MNYSGLKQASRVCLAESKTPYTKLTFLFLLCLYAFTIPCDVLIWIFNSQLNRLTGLDAVSGRSRIMLWNLIISVVSSLAATLWQIGYYAFTLRLSRAEGASFSTFWAAFQRFDQFLLLILLQGVLIFLWSMLFMIPGIVAAYRYRMAAYAMLDNPELTASEALSVSKRLTYGHKLELFLLDLSFLWYSVPLLLFSSLPLLPAYVPSLSGALVQLPLYAVSYILSFVWQCFFMPYILGTMAHAFNWLLELDRSRRDSLFGNWQG